MLNEHFIKNIRSRIIIVIYASYYIFDVNIPSKSMQKYQISQIQIYCKVYNIL